MKRFLLASVLCLTLAGSFAAFAGNSGKSLFLPGFEKPLSGVDFNYRSPLPQNEDAYILRNSFENPRMRWLTAPVHDLRGVEMVSFVFMAAMSTDQPNLSYSLKTGDGEEFRFTNREDKTWSIAGSNGGTLEFHQAKNLHGIEINGFMILTLPAGRLIPGQPVEITVSLTPSSTNSWIIIFKKPLFHGNAISNSPVLVREAGGLMQQVVVTQLRFRPPTTVVFSSGGRTLLTTRTTVGYNQFLVPVPVANSPRPMNLRLKYEDGIVENLDIKLLPVKKWEIYLVQHAHTDIGYTKPQSEILAEHLRYIDYALDYCDQTDLLPDDARFRWTCESTWVVGEYLRTRPKSQIERLKKRIAEGRIEVTGMYFNMAEIADENIMYDFFQPLREIRDQGIEVKTVMQNDVNGVAWVLPDYLKNTSVRYLTMGINETRSILPFKMPTCFWWESPSGSRLLAFRSDHYMTGNFFGLQDPGQFQPDNIFRYIMKLEENGYPFSRVAAQFSGYFTDNAPPSTAACDLVKAWNERYESPKLRLATASEFLSWVEQQHGSQLPVFRNAWLDWWTDGFGSTSRETAETRKVQNIKQSDEGLFAMVTGLGGELTDGLKARISHISENALFFDEHTVGADESIDRPFSENTTRQWLQKGAYAWEALKKVTLLNEDALGRIQPFLEKASFPVISVINPMGWPRSGMAELFIDNQILPPNKPFRIIDLQTGSEIPVQRLRTRSEGAYWGLQVSDVPAMGWKVYRVEYAGEENHVARPAETAELEMENAYYRIRTDRTTGAITSLFDKTLQKELADPGNPWKLGQLVRETLKDRNNLKDRSHSTIRNVRVENGINGDLWQSLKFTGDIDGFEPGTPGAPKGLEWEIRLWHQTPMIEFRFLGRKEILTSPEALYVTFPFLYPGSHIVFETIGGTVRQGSQLPGSSTDWTVAQDYTAIRGASGQIVVVSDEIPLWQYGGFNLGKFDRRQAPASPWINSWVMNNYWTTNFRAFQEGAFSWSYQITTMKDTTNSAAARFARGVRNPYLSRAVPASQGRIRQPSFGVLGIDASPNVIIAGARPEFDRPGSVVVRVREMDGQPGRLDLSSGASGKPIRKMVEVNVLGSEIAELRLKAELKPYEVKFLRLDFE